MTFDPSGVQVTGVIVSLLCGSGALGFFIKYGVRLAIVEKTAKDVQDDTKQNGKDIAATKERVTLVEKTLLDVANSIKDNVASLREMVSERFKDMVPRTEHLARWEAQDSKMADLKTQINDLREDLRR